MTATASSYGDGDPWPGDLPARADEFSGQGHSAKVVPYQYGSHWSNTHSGLVLNRFTISELPHPDPLAADWTLKTED